MEEPASKHLPMEDKRLFALMESALPLVPKLNLGATKKGKTIDLSAHIVARGIRKVFYKEGLRVVDGIYCGVHEHTWLVTRNGNIIDVLPVGAIGGPILVDGRRGSPAYYAYRPMLDMSPLKYRVRSKSWQRAIRIVDHAVWRALGKINRSSPSIRA